MNPRRTFLETPPQSCVVNVTSTRLYTLNHSGWWSIFSANNAVRLINDQAWLKSVNMNVFAIDLFSFVWHNNKWRKGTKQCRKDNLGSTVCCSFFHRLWYFDSTTYCNPWKRCSLIREQSNWCRDLLLCKFLRGLECSCARRKRSM